MLRRLLSIGVLLAIGTLVVSPAIALEGTATFEAAVEILPGQQPSPIKKHAVTRLVDWNQDPQLDLLVADGSGQVWIFLGGPTPASWQSGQPVQAAGADLKLGSGNVTACFVDVSGDGLSDLVAAHSDQQVVWLKNVGTKSAPVFQTPQRFAISNVASSSLQLPKGCGARLDVSDWDQDGLPDLFAGHFSGPILWYRNVGTKTEPRFESEGVPLTVGSTARQFSYNVHPTVADLNQDGRPDLLFGINWGTIGCFMRPSTSQSPNQPTRFVASPDISLASSQGALNLRAIAGDDTTPTLGDVDGDGTLDLISGGNNGKLWMLKGVSIRKTLQDITQVLEDHRQDLGVALKSDEALRQSLIGRLHGVYAHVTGFATSAQSRRPIRDWCSTTMQRHPQWLRRQHIDIKEQPYVPSIAYQFWTLLMQCHEGDPDALEHRRYVAATIGFEGRLRDILVEFGTLIIENGKATTNQQQTLYSYLSQIDRRLLGDRSLPAVTEVITIAEYLGPRVDVKNSGGVNIFANESGKIGSSENSFPKDFPGIKNDYFGLVLAHELNHRVDATRFVAVPKYNEKYWRHLRKICGPDVIFHEPVTRGVDWEATKKQMQAAGHWNGQGDAKAWETTWENYWLTGPGSNRTLNVCRNQTTYRPPRYGIPFFLETRQESIASLANQYFTDSVYMFEFAMDRYRRGSPGCLDEWLLMADVYSMDGATTYFYRHVNGDVNLQRFSTTLKRNEAGHIKSIVVNDTEYQFELDEEGLVNRVR